MSKSLIVWLALYFGGLARSLVHPIYPFISYLVFYYAPPHVNAWGNNLPDLRWSLTASAAMIASLVALNASLERLNDQRNPALLWLVMLGLNTMIVTTWALDRARSWYWAVAFLKLVLLYALIPAVVRTPAQFDMFGVTHVLGATYWGYKAWDDPHRNAGRLDNVGGPDSQNDNGAAGHLLTVIPFAALYALTWKKKSHQLGIAVCGAFIVNVFILCNSRGATLGLISAGVAAILLAGKGRRKKLLMVGVAGAVAVLFLADSRYISRQQTTVDPHDNSALSRFAMWQAGIEMMRDRPLGGGGRAFHILSPKYIPDIVEKTAKDVEERASHNTYIQLGTEWGVQALVLYAGLIIATLRMLHQIRRRAPDNNWYFYRSLVIEVALVGRMVAGFFSSNLYHESLYWMCALTFALHRIQSTELAGESAVSFTETEARKAPGPDWHPATRPRELPAG